MQRVSYRTLFLMVMLLGLIIVQQHTAKAVCARPDAVWLADEPNSPGPEWIGSAGLRMQSDTGDPNEPGPEFALGTSSATLLGDDPNEPGPEIVLAVPATLRLADEPNEPGPERV